jgi:4-aminobutyrate aminotransferase
VSAPEIADLAVAQAPRLITEVPGPEAMARIERDRKVTSPSLPRAYPFVPRRGAGSVVEDVDGNLFLDLNAGIAVTSTGHTHPRVVAAIQRQAEELIHYSASDFFLPIYTDVCERLDEIAGMSKPPRRWRPASSSRGTRPADSTSSRSSGRSTGVRMGASR